MNTIPKIMVWGFSDDEKTRFDLFLDELVSLNSTVISPDQGNLLVYEIIFSDKQTQDSFSSDQKVVLFFNVPGEIIQKIMRETKKNSLPQPIYAMVTQENINWKFIDLVNHLVKEHEYIQKRLKERKEVRQRYDN